MTEVVATAVVWDRVSDVLEELAKANLPGIDKKALEFAESQVYESLARAVLMNADEYRGFEEIQRALHGNPWEPR